MNRWIKLLLFVGVPTLLLFSFLIVKHRSERIERARAYQDYKQRRDKQMAADDAIWQQFKTTPVEVLDFVLLASNCPVSATPGLINHEQENKLRNAVADFWRWSSQTNFEVYRDLRLKTPYVLNQKAVDGLHKYLASQHKGANWPTDTEAILRRIWDENRSSRIAGTATGEISISVIKRIHDIDNPVYDIMKADPTGGTGSTTYPMYVEVHPTARETVQEHDEVLCGCVKQYVVFDAQINALKARGKGEVPTPLPLYASFYWSPELQQWLPWSVVVRRGPFSSIPF